MFHLAGVDKTRVPRRQVRADPADLQPTGRAVGEWQVETSGKEDDDVSRPISEASRSQKAIKDGVIPAAPATRSPAPGAPCTTPAN